MISPVKVFQWRNTNNNQNTAVTDQCYLSSHSTETNDSVHIRNTRPRGYKTFFMLNSAKHEICPANKSQITKNGKFFLAKHS